MNLSAEFEKWGRTLVIENTDSTQTAPFKGFIQPLRYKNKMYPHYILITYKNFRNLLQLRCQIMT